jgi:hypothetical protein
MARYYKEVDASKDLPHIKKGHDLSEPLWCDTGVKIKRVARYARNWVGWFRVEDSVEIDVKTWLKPTTLAEIIKDRITEEEIENILFRHRQSLDKGFYLKAAKAIMELITDKD